MDRRLREQDSPRLEGLCEPAARHAAGPRLHVGAAAPGLERMAAAFTKEAFAPHRHDTYAIGTTLSGVQRFRYRGARRHCLPGEWHVLHPDEVHDGQAGIETGFAYRIFYVDPALIQQALGGRPLPFVPEPVIRPRAADPLLWSWLADLDQPIGELERVDLASALAALLERHAPKQERPGGPLPLTALHRVRELIAEDPCRRHPVAVFERVAGLDRWTLARQFRAAFGTSPTRFRTLRQLDRARGLIRGGMALRDAALEAGFSDQAHLTRMFKRAYGLTPAHWASALR